MGWRWLIGKTKVALPIGSQCWRDQYQKEALALVSDFALLLEQLDSSDEYSLGAQTD
ncbi:hypothetical protein [Pseudomonas sp. N2-11]|uniref:hypothetical protein n=1 Tax=Pseudomonas sp. N2-11 TaxID=2962038 RepID=UPI0020B7B080|nr:hypothetical protein [Pseudomonas sp. N2-11]MCP3789890.1 hypothetical protein [Pseudomonas sp. N2-11]